MIYDISPEERKWDFYKKPLAKPKEEGGELFSSNYFIYFVGGIALLFLLILIFKRKKQKIEIKEI